MNSISLLFLFAVSAPALLAARIWWLDKRCDDMLAACAAHPPHQPHTFNQESTP